MTFVVQQSQFIVIKPHDLTIMTYDPINNAHDPTMDTYIMYMWPH